MEGPCTKKDRAGKRGFVLLQGLVAIAVIGFAVVSLYGGLTYGFSSLRLARENLRATQIMLERMETIRLYTWDQLITPGFLPTNFTASYFPAEESNGGNNGTVYTGSVTIRPLVLGTDYDDVIAEVLVEVQWHTGPILRRRNLSTYVSQFGLQNYIW